MSRSASRRSTTGTRLGLIRRRRTTAETGSQRGSTACPDCGLPSQDPVSARLGYCTRCNDFTGMCSAGRRIVSPDMMSVTSWHTPCTSLGVAAWQIPQGTGMRITLLCAEHDEQLRTGQAAWLRHAVPVDDPGRM